MRYFLLILLFSAGAFFGNEISAPEQDLLERGLEAEERGNYEEALSIWLEAKGEAERPSLRIGTNYIRVATEQEMDRYYPAASAMYLWGLSGEDVVFQKEYVMQELSFLEPMLTEEERKRWNGMLEANDPALLEEMQLWWAKRDPTPATPNNERLVEHWQRIAYAREHYTRTRRSVYGTDDRGVVYVQFGEPERKYDGRLQIMPAEVCQVIKERISAVGGLANCSDTGVRKMENRVWELWNNPYYEIWVYDEPNEEMRYNMIRIFADEPDGGEFNEINTLDELIPARGFSLTERYSYVGITAGIIMQWLFYNKMASVDAFFADRFSSLDFRFMRYESPRHQQYLGGQLKQENFHLTRQEQNRQPEEVSTHTKNLASIPLEVHQYRLLDEQNRPVFATFVNSRPQQAFLEDLVHNQDSMLANQQVDQVDSTAILRTFASSYRLYHGMELRNEQGRRLAGERLASTLMIDGSNMQVESGSVFVIPHHTKEAAQLFYAELHNRHPNSSASVETAFPDYLRGLGRLTIEQPDPLDSDPSQLQMSDLIMGYQKTDSSSVNSFVPFVVANDREIPVGEQLAVHFEVYHLQEGSNGLRDFTIDYEIRPVNFLGWTRERQDELSVTLFFEHDSPSYKEDLEIRAAGLEPGRYVLRMKATDRNSGQTDNREIEFRVVEPE